MKPLVTSKKVLILLCMCPDDKSFSIWKKIIRVVFAVMVFVLNAWVVEAHFSFFLKFMSINLAESLYAIMYAIAFFAPVYGMIIIFLLRNQIGCIFKNLSVIYDASKCWFCVIKCYFS